MLKEDKFFISIRQSQAIRLSSFVHEIMNDPFAYKIKVLFINLHIMIHQRFKFNPFEMKMNERKTNKN